MATGYHAMWRNRNTGDLASPWSDADAVFGDEWELVEINAETGEVVEVSKKKPIYIGFTPEQVKCIELGKRLVYADPDKRNRGVCPNLHLGLGMTAREVTCLDETADRYCPKERCKGIPTKECVDVVNPYGAY